MKNDDEDVCVYIVEKEVKNPYKSKVIVKNKGKNSTKICLKIILYLLSDFL